jgi:hypothetical protein
MLLKRLSFLVISLFFLIPLTASAGGTHFLVEPYTGVSFNAGFTKEDAVGLESGAVLAVGGKFKGFPPRFYLYMKASQSFFGSDDVFVAERQSNGCVRRSYTGVVGGLRTVIPLFWHLRLNLEVGAGTMFSRNKYTESGRKITEYDESLTVVDFGAGLNLRLYRWLSVGIMYDYRFVAEDEYGDMITTILGGHVTDAELGWSTVTATLGFHF